MYYRASQSEFAVKSSKLKTHVKHNQVETNETYIINDLSIIETIPKESNQNFKF